MGELSISVAAWRRRMKRRRKGKACLLSSAGMQVSHTAGQQAATWQGRAGAFRSRVRKPKVFRKAHS